MSISRSQKRIILNETRVNSSPYKYVNISDVRHADSKEGKASEPLWENTFLLSAVRLTQHLYRKKKGKLSVKPKSIRFLKEPVDEEYKTHAQHILANQWLEINYNDPNLIRNVYKAHRLRLINTEQLATASLWSYAIKFFQNDNNKTKVTLHSFLDKGPYDLNSIDYASPEEISNFANLLKNDPAADGYLAIDLPVEHEITLFAQLIFSNDIGQRKAFYHQALKNLFIKADSSYYLKHCETWEAAESIKELRKFFGYALSTLYPELKLKTRPGFVWAENTDKDSLILFDSYRFFKTLIYVDEQLPSLVISENFNPKNKNSPVFSFIVPSISAFRILQTAIHKKDATLPVFIVGKLTTRDIMKYYLKEDNKLRLVELVHPDVDCENNPHQYFTSTFMLIWHDLFHTWKDGANMYKDLFRHLVKFFQLATGYDMSADIWHWVDGDTSLGHHGRHGDKRSQGKFQRTFHLCNFIRNEPEKFWHALEDERNLLIFISMIKYSFIWENTLGVLPEDFFPKKTFAEKIWIEGGIQFIFNQEALNWDFTKFQFIFQEMKRIILAHPHDAKLDDFNSSLYYILLYKLKENPNAVEMINSMAAIGFRKFFSWTRNDGVILRDINGEKIPLPKQDKELFEKLNGVFLSYITLNKVLEPASSSLVSELKIEMKSSEVEEKKSQLIASLFSNESLSSTPLPAISSTFFAQIRSGSEQVNALSSDLKKGLT